MRNKRIINMKITKPLIAVNGKSKINLELINQLLDSLNFNSTLGAVLLPCSTALWQWYCPYSNLHLVGLGIQTGSFVTTSCSSDHKTTTTQVAFLLLCVYMFYSLLFFLYGDLECPERRLSRKCIIILPYWLQTLLIYVCVQNSVRSTFLNSLFFRHIMCCRHQ